VLHNENPSVHRGDEIGADARLASKYSPDGLRTDRNYEASQAIAWRNGAIVADYRNNSNYSWKMGGTSRLKAEELACGIHPDWQRAPPNRSQKALPTGSNSQAPISNAQQAGPFRTILK
jgi:hypothetical protein